MSNNPDIWEAIRKKQQNRFYVRWCAAVIVAALIWLVIQLVQLQGLDGTDWRDVFSILSIVSAGVFFAFRGSREADGPGRFRVVGVARTTRQDVFLDVDAANRENAKAKAEMGGIVVTKVYRVPVNA